MQELNQPLGARHIASLTHSGNLLLNIQQLKQMQLFSFEVVFLNQEESKVYAYPQEGSDCYILVVPLAFRNTGKRNRLFFNLLCLCSLTITIPVAEGLLQQFQDMLREFELHWRMKRGSSVVKLYIDKECCNSYLDFASFQDIEVKGNFIELLSRKKKNAYNFCIKSFEEELLPFIYQKDENEMEAALQCCTHRLSEMYISLSCHQRFQPIYDAVNPQNCTLKQLFRQIEQMTICRKITTVGDEQCQELVNEELSKIVGRQLMESEQMLLKMKKSEQQVYLVKIMHNILQKLKELHFQINEQKFLFINSKIVEKVYELHQQEIASTAQENKQLQDQVYTQRLQIETLQKNQASLQEKLTLKEKEEQKRIKYSECPPTVKRNRTETQPSLSGASLKDVKQPLQVINGNTLISSKLQKTSLQKAKDKIKDGFRQQAKGV